MEIKDAVTWVSEGPGRLALRGRPGRRLITRLGDQGCTHVVTLLSEREGAAELGQALEEAGIHWIWLPLAGGRAPTGETKERVLAALPVLSAALDAGGSLLIHCAAGIHRTGMIAYALLRWRGHTRAQALAKVGDLRGHTRAGLTDDLLTWWTEPEPSGSLTSDAVRLQGSPPDRRPGGD